MKRPLRYALLLFIFVLGAFAFGTVFSCHSSSSAPTQPVVNPTATPGVNPTATPGANPTPTPGANPTPTPSTGAHVVNVGQGGNNFVDSTSNNSTTSIKVGQTVMWTWVGGSHSTTSGVCCTPDGKWNSGVKSSGNFSQTFSTAGNFPYYCTVHGAMMTGMVMVSP